MSARFLALPRLALVLLLSLPVKFYRKFISPVLPPLCRFEPSCSRYALEALRVRGPVVGLALSLWRIARCNPWGGHGTDPVPLPRRPLSKAKSS